MIARRIVMDLLQLQYFKTVARLGHMTHTAEELHVAQPALSRTISKLEKELGVTLFDRVGRQIK
ncbi:LysR family transcriptional regulator [Clostridium saccharoperbutylacetonicum]|nr:LysR family transcriptional regulator [Clostridium saccharoperbutylacetonicum]